MTQENEHMKGLKSMLAFLRPIGWSWRWRSFFSGVWFDRDFKPWLLWRLNIGPLHIVRRNEGVSLVPQEVWDAWSARP